MSSILLQYSFFIIGWVWLKPFPSRSPSPFCDFPSICSCVVTVTCNKGVVLACDKARKAGVYCNGWRSSYTRWQTTHGSFDSCSGCRSFKNWWRLLGMHVPNALNPTNRVTNPPTNTQQDFIAPFCSGIFESPITKHSSFCGGILLKQPPQASRSTGTTASPLREFERIRL